MPTLALMLDTRAIQPSGTPIVRWDLKSGSVKSKRRIQTENQPSSRRDYREYRSSSYSDSLLGLLLVALVSLNDPTFQSTYSNRQTAFITERSNPKMFRLIMG